MSGSFVCAVVSGAGSMSGSFGSISVHGVAVLYCPNSVHDDVRFRCSQRGIVVHLSFQWGECFGWGEMSVVVRSVGWFQCMRLSAVLDRFSAVVLRCS